MESDLQDWQREILEMESVYGMIPLKEGQKRMIEELLFPTDSRPYWVEEKYKRVLHSVLTFGFYSEGDREILNYARECYLRGKNWIK